MQSTQIFLWLTFSVLKVIDPFIESILVYDESIIVCCERDINVLCSLGRIISEDFVRFI